MNKNICKFSHLIAQFEKSAITAVAKKAIELKTGARGLRTILEERMLDVMYTSHFDQNIEKIIIDENYILGKDKPIIIKANRQVS